MTIKEALEGRIAELEEALEFYANADSYKVQYGDDPVYSPDGYPTYSVMDLDRGRTARAVLGR